MRPGGSAIPPVRERDMLGGMADAYEREAMPGVGEMLHRQKVTSPKWALAIATLGPVIPLCGIGVTLLVGGQILGGAGALLGAALAFAGMSFLMVTFATARVAVSEGELHLQLGMAGPRIPIEDIASVSLAPSGSRRIGMGVRNDLRGTTTYTLWGHNARAVHVTKTDGKKIVIVCKDPDALHAALEDAMSRKGRAGPQVRVEVEEDHAAEARAQSRAER